MTNQTFKLVPSGKIAVIGCGAVGMAFVYAAVNQGLARDYLLIDMNQELAQGHAIDIEDTKYNVPVSFNSISAGSYEDLTDVDVLVLTAARPRKPGESRLELMADNAKTMKEIATKVKDSGFTGITIVAANPVDCLTHVYQQVTGFDRKRVIGSGTTLDTARMLNLLPASEGEVPAGIVLGEHGDSSVIISSIMPEELSETETTELHQKVADRGAEIIKLKKATYYGIGCALAKIASHILHDDDTVLPVGVVCDGEYGLHDVTLGLPARIAGQGIVEVVEMKLSDSEQQLLEKSAAILQENLAGVLNN